MALLGAVPLNLSDARAGKFPKCSPSVDGTFLRQLLQHVVQALHNSAEQNVYTYQVPQHNSTSVRENVSKLNTTTFVDALRIEKDRLHNEIEEFLTVLFYHVLKTNPKDKAIILCERLGGIRKLTEAIGYVLFKKFHVKSIFSLLSNALPLYTTGMETGITVDCGF